MKGDYIIQVIGDYKSIQYSISYSTINDIIWNNQNIKKNLTTRGFYKLDPGFPLTFNLDSENAMYFLLGKEFLYTKNKVALTHLEG